MFIFPLKSDSHEAIEQVKNSFSCESSVSVAVVVGDIQPLVSNKKSSAAEGNRGMRDVLNSLLGAVAMQPRWPSDLFCSESCACERGLRIRVNETHSAGTPQVYVTSAVHWSLRHQRGTSMSQT